MKAKTFLTSTLWRMNRTSLPAFISGSPRSGTTWMMEVLEQVSASRIHWEPINWYLYDTNYDRSEDASGWMRADEDCLSRDAALREEYLRILSGGAPRRAAMTRINRMGQMGNMRRLLTARQTLVKFVYSQRATPWLAANTQNPGSVILRHPAAVVASQLHHPYRANGGQGHPEWQDTVLQRIHPMMSPADLERWPGLKGLLARNLSVVEKLAITACLDILHPLHSERTRKTYAFVVYEALRSSPNAFSQLAGALQLDIKREPDAALLDRRSRTTSDQSPDTIAAASGVGRLSGSERAAVQEIIEAMDLPMFRADGTVDVQGLSAFGFRNLIA